MKALTVSAHIIDSLIGCGGVLMQLVDRGDPVKVVFTSDMRRESIPGMMETLGIGDFEVLDFAINSQKERFDDLQAELARIISAYDPDVVFTLWPSDLVLSDHCMTGRAVQRVFVDRFGIDSERRLYFFEVTQYVPDFRPEVYVNIPEELWQRKAECVAAMEAYSEKEKDLILDEMELRALQHGAECAAPSRYAEAFARFRPRIVPVSAL